MTDRFKSWLLGVLRVPSEPQPPAGAPESVRVFRAAPNYYRLKLLKWGLSQCATLVGLLVFVPVAGSMEFGPASGVLRIVESFAVVGFFLQLPITYLVVRFDYELRWYIVTDRSLRIRYGLQQIREMTMTFANIQQITIHQGPLQRLMGIADLQVRTAGGGAGDGHGETGQAGASAQSMHLGYFRGVENATEIRDLMLARLRHWRDAGLGDPDDVPHALSLDMAPTLVTADVLQAARAVLEETRALRTVAENAARPCEDAR